MTSTRLEDFYAEPDTANIVTYLVDHGFPPATATRIALHAMIKFGELPIADIQEAAADLGFEVASIIPLAPLTFKDRN